MTDRGYEKPADEIMREAQIARDEEHAGRVEGNPWDEFTDSGGPELL